MLHLITGANVDPQTDDPAKYFMTMPLDDQILLAIRQGIRARDAANSQLPSLFENGVMKTFIITNEGGVVVDLPLPPSDKTELHQIEIDARRMRVLFWNPPAWKCLRAQGINIKNIKRKLKDWTKDDPYVIVDIDIEKMLQWPDALPEEYRNRNYPYKWARATFTTWNELGFTDEYLSAPNQQRVYQSTYFSPTILLDECDKLRAQANAAQ